MPAMRIVKQVTLVSTEKIASIFCAYFCLQDRIQHVRLSGRFLPRLGPGQAAQVQGNRAT
jgi:hypothetical protein